MKTVFPVVAYVAGPYRGSSISDVRRNIEDARTVAEALWSRGVPTFCPHLNTALMDGIAEDDIFLAGDLLMLARCDLVVLTKRWDTSTGAKAEAEEARRRGLLVLEWPHEEGRLHSWLTAQYPRECQARRDEVSAFYFEVTGKEIAIP